MSKKYKKIHRFITHDLWFTDIENSFSGVKRIFLKELQMIILVIKSAQKNFLMSRASSLAFTTLLSLIPVLAIMFMFFKAFGGQMVETKIKPLIYEYLTAGIGDSISEYIDSFLNSATVDTLGTVGVLFLLVAVYSILSSIESSFNYIWQVKKNRPFLEMIKTYLSIIFIAPILLIGSIWLTSRLEFLVQIGDNVWEGFSAFMLFHAAPFIMLTVMFLAIIMIIPNTKVKVINAIRGAVFGALSYTILKALFIHYTVLAVSYNKIYGSIAVLPFFMLWIYFSWIVVLLSVQISFVSQNVHNLKHLEKNMVSNRIDRIKIGLMVMFRITQRFISGSEQSTLYELSKEFDIPVKDLSKCISNLENSGIIVEVAKKQDGYTLNTPLKDLTVGRIVDSVDKMYLSNKEFKSEDLFPGLKKIIKDNRIITGHDELLTDFIEQ